MTGISLVRALLAFIFICMFSGFAWANSVSIGWNANSESDLAGYNIYRSSSSGSGYARINSSLIKTTSYQDYNVSAGQTRYYVVTAVNTRGQESRYSSEVKAVVGCGYTISPTSRQHASTSGTGSISVTSSSGCPWTAKSSASWITITSGSSGQGSGTVTYSLTSNTSSTRMGSITVQDKSFTISQSGTSTSTSTTGGCGIATVASDRWKGEYFNNMTLSGTPALVRDDGNGFLDFNWGSGSPASTCGIGINYFSVRWTRTVYLSAGRWRFTTSTDDGVRLYVNGKLVISQWRDQSLKSYTVDLDLAAGNHTVRMEYYENSGSAVAKLTWSLLSTSTTSTSTTSTSTTSTSTTSTSTSTSTTTATSWKGEYFTNKTLSGTPALVRNDGTSYLKFDWGSGSPASNIPVDGFSVRWTRTVYLNAGTYTFTATHDDGARLYVNGNLVINRWVDGTRTVSATVTLPAGNHTLRFEYYENTGKALASLTW